MKTTFDLPEALLRRAKAAAAHQGRPLRDLVAEALTEKLAAERHRASKATSSEWEAFKAKLIEQPDGTYFNPDGIDDVGFFEALDQIRQEGRKWTRRDPFAARPAKRTPSRRTRRRQKQA